jgi:hypothetical protein
VKATNIVLLLIFGLIPAWYSYLVWFKPEVLLKWTRAFRSRWYKSHWVVFQNEWLRINWIMIRSVNFGWRA